MRLSEKREFSLIEGLNQIGLAETMYERHDEALVQAGRTLDSMERLGYALGLAWAKCTAGLMHYERDALPLAGTRVPD